MTNQSAGDDFYVSAIQLLQKVDIPFLVGGAYGLRHYTGIVRDTKDFDVFIRPADLERTLSAFHDAGYRAEVAFRHWLAKVHHGESFIDVIFRAGNGLCEVDDAWFRGTAEAALLGEKVPIVPPEEMIWQKAYIMERERFDGADVAHVIRACSEQIDWTHLLERFGPDWRVLYSHLVLFGFIYPAERARVPKEVLDLLAQRLGEETTQPPAQDAERVCQGALLSRAQYLPDIERWSYQDPRESERCRITPEEIAAWTDAIAAQGTS